MTGGDERDDLGFGELDAALRALLGATQPLALEADALVVRPDSGADVQTPPATRPDVASTSASTSATTVPVTPDRVFTPPSVDDHGGSRSEEHTSELQSP